MGEHDAQGSDNPEHDAEQIGEGQSQGEWLTLAEAAERLGISIYTVRRQAKRGELKARQVATRHGLAWQVSLGNLPGVAPTVSSTPNQAAESHIVPELLYLIERLQADYRASAERHQQQVMELSGRLGFMQAELQQAREQLALMAPKEEPPGNLSRRMTGFPAPEPEAAPGPAQKPWWRFWDRR